MGCCCQKAATAGAGPAGGRAAAAQQPKVLLTNGLQDVEPYFILQQNDAMHKFLKPLGACGYRRLQWNGVHEWNFWDRSLCTPSIIS
jgi:S-formylglutathione hydrolase FrmB